MPRAVCHVALGGLPLRRRLRQRGFGLRHVGPGDLADTEPVVGRLELLCQHLLIVDGECQKLQRLDHADLDLGRGDRRRRADIGDHRVDEAGLLLRDQVGALRHHLVLGAVHVGLCLAARVDGLGQRRLCRADQPVGLRGQRAAAPRPGERAAHAVAVAGGSRHHDGGPPARQRLRHVLVGGPQLRPLGQQRRLVGVGQCEGLGQRMRRARLRRWRDGHRRHRLHPRLGDSYVLGGPCFGCRLARGGRARRRLAKGGAGRDDHTETEHPAVP